jgi:hypothetical protein
MTSRATSPRIAPSRSRLFWPEGCIPFSCMNSSYRRHLAAYPVTCCYQAAAHAATGEARPRGVNPEPQGRGSSLERPVDDRPVQSAAKTAARGNPR